MTRDKINQFFSTKKALFISYAIYSVLFIAAIILSIKITDAILFIIFLFILSSAEAYLLSTLPYFGIGLGGLLQLLLGIFTGKVMLTILTLIIYILTLCVLHIRNIEISAIHKEDLVKPLD